MNDLDTNTFVALSMNHDLLDCEEEKRLLEQAKAGDAEAINLIVNHNQRLVISIAKRYYRACAREEIELCDLIQAGNIGLYKAVTMWDASKKVRFSTYAYYWIRAFVRRLALHRSTTVSVSYGFSEKLNTIRKARNELLGDGYEPTVAKLAEFTGLAEKDVSMGLIAITMSVSLYESRNDECRPYSETLRDEAQDTETEGITKALVSQAYSIIDQMPERWGFVIRHRFGLNGARQMTQAQLGQLLNVTRQNIDHIEKAALRRIKQSMVASNASTP